MGWCASHRVELVLGMRSDSLVWKLVSKHAAAWQLRKVKVGHPSPTRRGISMASLQ